MLYCIDLQSDSFLKQMQLRGCFACVVDYCFDWDFIDSQLLECNFGAWIWGSLASYVCQWSSE